MKSNIEIKSKDIVTVDIDKLIPNSKNANRHSVEQIERLAKIIKHNGFRNPIIVSNRSGFMIAGHGRLDAAKKLGMSTVPVIFQDFASEAEEYQFMTADNEIARWAELDLHALLTDLKDFPELDVDMLGIEDFKLPDVEQVEGTDDEVGEPPAVPVTAPGDIWELGDHRLMCGDSTNIQSVEDLMAGNKADTCFTSPPYNLGNNAKLRGYNGDGDESAYIETSDHKTPEEYLDFLYAFTNNALTVSHTAFINIQLLAGNKTVLPRYWETYAEQTIDVMIWDKEHAQPSAAERVLNSVWEFIFILTSEQLPKRTMKHGPNFRGDTDNIFRLNPCGKKDALAKDHGAVFPLDFARHIVGKFSDEKVYEPFGGSGTTLIACHELGRRCFTMELDPRYCDVIIQRWERVSGKQARLSATGETYADLKSNQGAV